MQLYVRVKKGLSIRVKGHCVTLPKARKRISAAHR